MFSHFQFKMILCPWSIVIIIISTSPWRGDNSILLDSSPWRQTDSRSFEIYLERSSGSLPRLPTLLASSILHHMSPTATHLSLPMETFWKIRKVRALECPWRLEIIRLSYQCSALGRHRWYQIRHHHHHHHHQCWRHIISSSFIHFTWKLNDFW